MIVDRLRRLSKYRLGLKWKEPCGYLIEHCRHGLANDKHIQSARRLALEGEGDRILALAEMADQATAVFRIIDDPRTGRREMDWCCAIRERRNRCNGPD